MPEDKEYWDGLALLYSAMTRSKDGDHSVAIEQYTLALQLFKKLAELESDRKTEAKGLYVATLSLRGDSYKAKREFEIALADYNMALELRPENVQAYMGRADLYESMGERERAIADYQKALAVGPNMLPQFVGQCTDALKRLGTIIKPGIKSGFADTKSFWPCAVCFTAAFGRSRQRLMLALHSVLENSGPSRPAPREGSGGEGPEAEQHHCSCRAPALEGHFEF